MKVVQQQVAGFSCHFTFSTDPKSTLTLYISPEVPISIPPPMGSLAYGVPKISASNGCIEPLVTQLFSHPSSIDSATQVTRLLVNKFGRPVLVGSSASEMVPLTAIYGFIKNCMEQEGAEKTQIKDK